MNILDDLVNYLTINLWNFKSPKTYKSTTKGGKKRERERERDKRRQFENQAFILIMIKIMFTFKKIESRAVK